MKILIFGRKSYLPTSRPRSNVKPFQDALLLPRVRGAYTEKAGMISLVLFTKTPQHRMSNRRTHRLSNFPLPQRS